MTKEQEIIVGEQIKQLAEAICSAPRCQWSNIVFTVAYRKGKTSSRLSDVFYFREYEDDDYINAYSEEGNASINMGILRNISNAYRKLHQVCGEFGSLWSQYTICIDRKGHFESFFDYPQQFGDTDPFDRKNMELWEMRFLYGE